MFDSLIDYATAQLMLYLPELVITFGGFVTGLLPLLAKKVAMKKNAQALSELIVEYNKIMADREVSNKEYESFGRKALPILDDFMKKFSGLSWWASGKLKEVIAKIFNRKK